jgi:hypothetical protein
MDSLANYIDPQGTEVQMIAADGATSKEAKQANADAKKYVDDYDSNLKDKWIPGVQEFGKDKFAQLVDAGKVTWNGTKYSGSYDDFIKRLEREEKSSYTEVTKGDDADFLKNSQRTGR